MSEQTTCVLCGETVEDFGHNPWPLSEDGRACDDCNFNKVIIARINQIPDKQEVPDGETE